MAAAEPDAQLLDRDDAMAQLDAELERARLGSGRVALVSGEAGVGKTSLVRSFVERHQHEVRVVWGACEGLFTPRPLGPIYDIVHQLEGFSAEPPTSAAERATYFGALLDALQSRPTIAVFEDMHWADAATLDAVEHLVAHRDSAPILLVLTYDSRVPLEETLASTHVVLSPLGADAVAALARNAERGAHGLYETTGGNPYFVTEVLTGEGGDIPATASDAVLARAERLSPGGRALLEAVAIVPGSVDIRMLEELAGDDFAHLAECLSTGMLVPTSAGIGFRHELGRVAVEHSLAPDRRIELNQRALRALEARPDGALDLSSLAHHADAAGDADAVVRFAPQAAAHAARLGAHRDAAEHYARALSYHASPDRIRLALLQSYAAELVLSGRAAEAHDAREEAAALEHALPIEDGARGPTG